jgi:hypothetical protein
MHKRQGSKKSFSWRERQPRDTEEQRAKLKSADYVGGMDKCDGQGFQMVGARPAIVRIITSSRIEKVEGLQVGLEPLVTHIQEPLPRMDSLTDMPAPF